MELMGNERHVLTVTAIDVVSFPAAITVMSSTHFKIFEYVLIEPFSLCCRRRMGHATVVLSFVLCHFWSVVANAVVPRNWLYSQQWMYLEATIHLLRSIRLSTFLSTVLSLQCLVQSLGRWIGFGVQAKRQPYPKNELWLIAQWEAIQYYSYAMSLSWYRKETTLPMCIAILCSFHSTWVLHMLMHRGKTQSTLVAWRRCWLKM